MCLARESLGLGPGKINFFPAKLLEKLWNIFIISE